MNRIAELVSDEQLEKAFKGTNYGDKNPRDVIKLGLMKVACEYHNGHTTQQILLHLELQTKDLKLTNKGRQYLYDAYTKN